MGYKRNENHKCGKQKTRPQTLISKLNIHMDFDLVTIRAIPPCTGRTLALYNRLLASLTIPSLKNRKHLDRRRSRHSPFHSRQPNLLHNVAHRRDQPRSTPPRLRLRKFENQIPLRRTKPQSIRSVEPRQRRRRSIIIKINIKESGQATSLPT